jgi:hypothetical protein
MGRNSSGVDWVIRSTAIGAALRLDLFRIISQGAFARKNLGFVGSKWVARLHRRRGKSMWSQPLRLR